MILDDVRVLLTSDDDRDDAVGKAEAIGLNVVGSVEWDGPVPEGSFTVVAPMVRMSTPEFFLYRMTNTFVANDAFFEAVAYAEEMLGTVVTSRTKPSLERGAYEEVDEPRTSVRDMLEYLLPIVEDDTAITCMKVILCANPRAYEEFVKLEYERA